MIYYSFIIPHHNCPKLLYRLLDSIPQREDIEIIVIDDNSSHDKKPEVIRSDMKIVFLSAEESRGAGHARNVGLDAAKGKWLLFADSDDYYESNLMTVLDQYRESNNDIVYFGYNEVINHEKRVSEWNKKRFNDFFSSPQNLQAIHRLGLSTNSPWNKMYSHQFIDQINCRFEEIPVGNDAWFVNFAGTNASTITVLDIPLYNYIIISTGITQKKRPLNHYLQLIESAKKRNKLKQQANCYDTIHIPGFNREVVIRDYGYGVYYRLFLKRVFTEYPFFIALCQAILRKIRLI